MKKILATTFAALGLGAALMPAPAAAQAGSDPLLGQMVTVGFNFCPRGWASAEGQLLPINQNQALYALLGTMYGGDGRTSFALPDLRGRVNIGAGRGPGLSNHIIGERGGTETVTLNVTTMASHNHSSALKGSSAGADSAAPNGLSLASAAIYTVRGAADSTLNAGTVVTDSAGGNIPFDIRMPFQTVKTCIALQGLFPSRN